METKSSLTQDGRHQSSYIIAVTGHRPNRLGGYAPCERHKVIRRHMRDFLIEIREKYPNLKLISGGALGIDQFWMAVGHYLQIPVIAAIPFEGFERKWPKSSQEEWKKLLDKCDEAIYTSSEGYKPNKMQIRNEWMVDHSDTLVAYWDGSKGGTANCIEYAQSVHKPIIQFDLNEITRNDL